MRLEPLERDQRSKRATLTEAGERLLAGPLARAEAAEAAAWLSLSEADRGTLVGLTRQFTAALLGALEQSNAGSSEDL